MDRCALGQQGLEVSILGLGCLGMSTARGADGIPDEGQSIETLHRALDIGITFLDTADVYGPYLNERLLSRFLATRRDEVQLATKFGIATDGAEPVVDGRPEWAAECCNQSLERLNVAVIDLYYLHRVDPGVPVEESVGAMSELVTAGKVRYLGLCEVSGDTLRRANAVHPISAVQSEYSLWTREPEQNILPVANELGVGFVPFAPLGRGFLTGSITSVNDIPEGDVRRAYPRFADANMSTNQRILKSIQDLALEKKVSSAQLALAWLLSRRPRVVPIPGTISPTRLAENAAATELLLSFEELEYIEAAAPVGGAAGERYGESWMRLTNN